MTVMFHTNAHDSIMNTKRNKIIRHLPPRRSPILLQIAVKVLRKVGTHEPVRRPQAADHVRKPGYLEGVPDGEALVQQRRHAALGRGAGREEGEDAPRGAQVSDLLDGQVVFSESAAVGVVILVGVENEVACGWVAGVRDAVARDMEPGAGGGAGHDFVVGRLAKHLPVDGGCFLGDLLDFGGCEERVLWNGLSNGRCVL